ncbi:hypothetical protein GF369_03965 [Candidatus Peregrinibacteria bacterium]|nr:hypothetical protein [Candidatus Peregrinibacteria bacterium]
MLDIIHTTNFFHLIGERKIPEEENFTKIFLLLDGLNRRSLTTLMITSDVPWETVRAFCDLSENEYQLLERLLRLEHFNQSYMCIYEGCEKAVGKFLTMFKTDLAHKCLKTMREFSIQRTAPLTETSNSLS